MHGASDARKEVEMNGRKYLQKNEWHSNERITAELDVNDHVTTFHRHNIVIYALLSCVESLSCEVPAHVLKYPCRGLETTPQSPQISPFFISRGKRWNGRYPLITSTFGVTSNQNMFCIYIYLLNQCELGVCMESGYEISVPPRFSSWLTTLGKLHQAF